MFKNQKIRNHITVARKRESMVENEIRVWGIHTKNDQVFLEHNVIAIGWQEIGNISSIASNRELIKDKYRETYKNSKEGNVAVCSGQIYRFYNECKIGDYIVFPSKFDSKINIGIVETETFFQSDFPNYPHQKKVKWIKKGLHRTNFSQGALYEIGSAMTFFSVKNYADEFLSVLNNGIEINTTEDENEEISLQADTIIANTKDYILKQLSTNFKGYPLENLVANLLEAMGYKVIQSKQGGDRGIDIIIYKDELPPRIVVQVKSYDNDVAEKDLQALAGAKNQCDYGLFVTLSDYSKNAKKYLETHSDIRGINGYELVDLLLQYYDKLSDKYRNLIPLRKVYIPVVDSE